MSFKQEKILNFEKKFVFNSIAEHLFLVYQQEPEPPLGSGSSQKRAAPGKIFGPVSGSTV